MKGMRQGGFEHNLERELETAANFLALIALAVVGRRASATFRFFVMAGLDPAIHENAKSRNQVNDNVT